MSQNGTVLKILVTKQSNAFFLKFSCYLIAYDCTGHMEGSCVGNDLSITSVNSSYSLNCYSGVHSFSRLSSAWSSFLYVKTSNVTHLFIQLIEWKVVFFVITCFIWLCSRNGKWYWREWKKKFLKRSMLN